MATFIFPLNMPWDYNLFQNSGNVLLPPRVRSLSFEAEGQEAFAPEAGGRFVSVHLGPALWRMQLSTPVLSEQQFSVWRTWFDVLEGSKNEFLGYDVRRPMPWNYRSGYAGLVRAGTANAFIGGDTVVGSINTAREEITNTTGAFISLPQGFQLEVGDYCTLLWNNPSNPAENLFSLHRLVRRPAAANSSGVTTIHVRPRVHPDIPASGTSMIFGDIGMEPPNRHGCLMRVTRRDRQADAKSRSISFEAVQSLRFK